MILARGCTPIHRFSVPYEADEIEVMYITYEQNGVAVLEKTKEDCTFEDGWALLQLTQEETLKFEPRTKVKIQIRLKRTDGEAEKSNILSATPDELLKEGAI